MLRPFLCMRATMTVLFSLWTVFAAPASEGVALAVLKPDWGGSAPTATVVDSRSDSWAHIMTSFGAHEGENEVHGHRCNQFRFSSNSADHVVTTGEAGANLGSVFLHKVSTDESWVIESPAEYERNVIGDWWMGALPSEGSTITLSSATARKGARRIGTVIRFRAGAPFTFNGPAGHLRIIDSNGRTADVIALDDTDSMHKVNWGGARGMYWAVPVQ